MSEIVETRVFFCFQNIVQSFVPVFHVLVILLHDRFYSMLIL
ncbi:Uncharacterised protein [Streptococcus pneumoniae]|nr:Uncharacterised protein [Streptococcus pneumoniae]